MALEALQYGLKEYDMYVISANITEDEFYMLSKQGVATLNDVNQIRSALGKQKITHQQNYQVVHKHWMIWMFDLRGIVFSIKQADKSIKINEKIQNVMDWMKSQIKDLYIEIIEHPSFDIFFIGYPEESKTTII